MDSSHAYTLADGTVLGQRTGIKDNLGIATYAAPIVISGNIDGVGALSIHINQPFGALEFVWKGTYWSVF